MIDLDLHLYVEEWRALLALLHTAAADAATEADDQRFRMLVGLIKRIEMP